MEDFIFGTLATEELRLRHVRSHRRGVTHAQARFPRDPLPEQPLLLELTIGPQVPLDQAWVEWKVDQTWNITPMETVGSEWDTLVWGYVRRFRAVLPGQPEGTVLHYRIAAGMPGGQPIYADQGAQYACYFADDPALAWTQEAVVYQVFVDRFYPGKGKRWLKPGTPVGFYGGRLAGVTEKLDYIATLGANVLWLSPIFPSPSHHGYDATDYFEIEPRLGTKQDLEQLLQEAHQRGMRVLLDFVPNHWSWLHPTFQQALRDAKSPYMDWYLFSHWPDQYETFFGVRELPQINLLNPGARQHMLEAANHWLKMGVDGYRVDYAVGPTPDFWADFRRVCRAANPECWTFGEVVEPPDSQINFEGSLDGCLDFNLLEALRQAFAFGRWDAEQFASFLTRHEAFFPPTFSRPTFLDNHDMNRFLWAVENDKRRLRLAALCQFTISGQPVIYYGTEIGLSQERDVRQDGNGLPEESRLPMLWGKQQDAVLLDFYRRLIQLRLREPALRHGGSRILYAYQHLLVYGRGSFAIVLNLADQTSRLELPASWHTMILASEPGCKLEMRGAEHLSVELPPYGGMVLV